MVDEDKWDKYYDEAQQFLHKENDLKQDYFEHLRCYDFDKENAKISLRYVKTFYDLFKKILPIAIKYKQSVDDFYNGLILAVFSGYFFADIPQPDNT